MNEVRPLKSLEEFYPLRRFSHIYIEEKASGYPMTHKILEKFPSSIPIVIKHYKDVFNRSRQDFLRQKQSPKLILAVKEEPFLYEGPEICEDFGNSNFYYTSSIMNCPYNCDYCYLQGLYPSANIVIFVNIQDFFCEVNRQLLKGPLYLTTSYDTDMMAFEGIVPYTSRWIEFARERDNLLIEIRSKSANYPSIRSLEPTNNVILAWTLSPEEIAQKYEKLAPPLEARLSSVRKAIEDGWLVRLSLEPMIRVDDWQGIYGSFVDRIFATIPPEGITDINIGVFRMNKEYFKKIRKARHDTDIFCQSVEYQNGIARYPEEEKMKKFLRQRIMHYYPEDKIFG